MVVWVVVCMCCDYSSKDCWIQPGLECKCSCWLDIQLQPDIVNRTQSNAIEWLRFDCRTQSNLNRILPRFPGSIVVRLIFDCRTQSNQSNFTAISRFDCFDCYCYSSVERNRINRILLRFPDLIASIAIRLSNFWH